MVLAKCRSNAFQCPVLVAKLSWSYSCDLLEVTRKVCLISEPNNDGNIG